MRRKRIKIRVEEARLWLEKAVQTAPRPLPAGVFPRILERSENEGFSRNELLDVLDDWLNNGLCILTDHISQDIELTEKGETFFYGG